MDDIESMDIEQTEFEKIRSDLELISYILSHDFKKPIRNISMATMDLRDSINIDASPEVSHYVEEVEYHLGEMKIMVEALLEYTQYQLYPPQTKPVDCNNLLQKIKDNFVEKYPNFQLNTGFLPTIKGSEKHLYYLFTQLINNAVKFAKANEALKIEISAEKQDHNYLFKVSDNGIGIEEDFFEVIFVLFQRLHLKEEIPGYGIGLALCKKIVEFHHGNMWVESKFGQGSDFYFTLPAINE